MTSPAATTTPLRALIVDDSESDADLIRFALRRGDHGLESAPRVETRKEFLRELGKVPDIILCDYNMPHFSAAETLELVKQQAMDVPVIIISGSIGEETAAELIKRGAEDYLLKDRLGRLWPAIEHALEQKKLRAEARRVEEELRESEFKYRCLFNHLIDAAYLCDATTLRIIDTNIQGERFLGLDRASILGLRLGLILPAPVIERLLAPRPEEPAPTVDITTEINGPDGRPRSVHVRAAAMIIHRHRLLLVLVRSLGEPASC